MDEMTLDSEFLAFKKYRRQHTQENKKKTNFT